MHSFSEVVIWRSYVITTVNEMSAVLTFYVASNAKVYFLLQLLRSFLQRTKICTCMSKHTHPIVPKSANKESAGYANNAL